MSTQSAAILNEFFLEPLLIRDDAALQANQIDEERQAKLQHEIDLALAQIDHPETYQIAQILLGDFARLFARLALIESNLNKLDTLQETLSILEVVEFETRSVVDFIETKAMRTEGIGDKLQETLDGISYGITHDVRRIFERELVGSLLAQSTPVVYGKIVHAHGLLTNCLQQSTITLLQIFNPGMDPLSLFEDCEERMKQSLRLCRDLSSLVRVVRQAEAQGTPDMLRKVVGRILAFRDGSMQWLMYRDWRGYEKMALEVITAIENNCDSKDLLHRFTCYLEVLYGHVKMRAVLKEKFSSSGEGAIDEFASQS